MMLEKLTGTQTSSLTVRVTVCRDALWLLGEVLATREVIRCTDTAY